MPIMEQSSGNLFIGIGGATIMDPQGAIIHTQDLDVLPMTKVQSLRKVTDNEFWFTAGIIADSCAVGQSLKVDPVIGKMDSLGNLMSMQRYTLNALTCSHTAVEFYKIR